MGRITLLVLALSAVGRTVAGQTSTEAVTPGAVRSYSTIYSIGVEWDVMGDADHDASAAVEYRVRGTTAWQSALSLVRVDYNARNMLAGSLLFLTPGTAYEVRLSLTDPDGGADARQIAASTRSLPRMPVGGPVFHVVPGTGGGDGSLASPFRGVAAAQAVAQPGDTFLLHAGDYGGRVRFDTPGTGTSYIVWKAAGDGEVRLRGIDVAASHVWLEGLVVRDLSWALLSFNSPTNVVVTRCQFVNNTNAVLLQGAGTNWYIADNTIVGNTPADSGSLAGEGVDLNVTSGHTVAHNSITNVADGVSYPDTNVDVFGNDIFDTSDDGIELDNGRANVRVWGNRIHNAVHNGISFQPQSGAPWYIVRNQIVGSVEAAFKFRTTDRFVLLHNTIVHWGDAWPGTSMMCCNEWSLLKAYARNNLWVSVQGGQIWGFESNTRDWQSDLDYDGFDWGTSTEPFSYGGVTYTDVWSFSHASGLETNARQVSHGTCFDDFRVPGPSPMSVPPHVMALQPGCEAVDSGMFLPNINDGFAGSAPDRGAHEYGHATTAYGPRPLATAAPSAPTQLTATAGTAQIDLRWNDASTNEAGFSIDRSTAGQPFVRIATVAADTTTYNDASAAVGTEYVYRVAAYNEAASSPYSNTASATVHAGLPSPWRSGDIGAVGVAGSVSASNGIFTVKGSGADIWGAADALHYVWQPVTGDVDLIARVASVQHVHAWTKAGVMIRASLAADAAHGLMLVSPASGLAFQRRTATGGLSTHTAGGSGTSPVWVKLERRGTTLIAYRSANGVTWTLVGRATVTLGASAYIGLALSAHDNMKLATATFDNVAVHPVSTGPGPNASPSVAMTSPATGAAFTAPATIRPAATASDSDGTIAQVQFYAGTTLLGTDTSAPYETTWTDVAAGSYSLTARATDDRGAVTTSSAVTITVSEPTGLPSPWRSGDIGAVGVAGSASASNGIFTVKGSGADIWGAADALTYVWQPITGDVDVIARVASVGYVHAWTKAGVMIRASLAANAAHGLMLVSPGNGLAFQRRSATGGLSAHTAGGSGTAPVWVKLERRGNTLTAYRSADGNTWTLVGRATVTLGSSAYVGLALSAHDNTKLATATFDRVSVTPR